MMKKLDTQDSLIYLKAGLFCVILFFWMTGVALICVGATVQMGLYDVSVILVEASSGAPIVLTVVGLIIFFLSGFGAVAAIKENHVLIKCFSGIMLLVFIIEIIVGISAYSNRDQLQSKMSRNFLGLLDQYDFNPQISKGLDYLQQKFNCCGAQNYTDWFNTTFRTSVSSVPISCCKKVQFECGDNPLKNLQNIYQEGCVEKLRQWIGSHVGVIGAVGIGLGIAQIFGILFSCLLVKLLQENYVSM